MPTDSLSIKPNNHRIYKCPSDKKIELLKKIVAENKNLNILVTSSKDTQVIIDALNDESIKIIEDRELIKDKALRCEMLISYDLPIKNIVYMARVAKATQKAVMLLDESEQTGLYQIEMLLGRAIKQESIEGFAYEEPTPKQEIKGRKPLSKEQIREVAKKRYEEKTAEPKEKSYEEKSYDKNTPKKEYHKSDTSDKWAKKKKAPNKFLGKDEKGKALFSGKSGDRNHRYDGTPRDKWDAPKKTGRTINIKARKPKGE